MGDEIRAVGERSVGSIGFRRALAAVAIGGGLVWFFLSEAPRLVAPAFDWQETRDDPSYALLATAVLLWTWISRSRRGAPRPLGLALAWAAGPLTVHFARSALPSPSWGPLPPLRQILIDVVWEAASDQSLTVALALSFAIGRLALRSCPQEVNARRGFPTSSLILCLWSFGLVRALISAYDYGGHSPGSVWTLLFPLTVAPLAVLGALVPILLVAEGKRAFRDGPGVCAGFAGLTLLMLFLALVDGIYSKLPPVDDDPPRPTAWAPVLPPEPERLYPCPREFASE